MAPPAAIRAPKCPMISIALLVLLAGNVPSDDGLPARYTRCTGDADCSKLGSSYKCITQKYPCGPASTCGARVCVKSAPTPPPAKRLRK